MGENQSMSSSSLTLSPLLLQIEGKHLFQHTCHSVVTIGLLKHNSYILILEKLSEISCTGLLYLRQAQVFSLDGYF